MINTCFLTLMTIKYQKLSLTPSPSKPYICPHQDHMSAISDHEDKKVSKNFPCLCPHQYHMSAISDPDHPAVVVVYVCIELYP